MKYLNRSWCIDSQFLRSHREINSNFKITLRAKGIFSTCLKRFLRIFKTDKKLSYKGGKYFSDTFATQNRTKTFCLTE